MSLVITTTWSVTALTAFGCMGCHTCCRHYTLPVGVADEMRRFLLS